MARWKLMQPHYLRIPGTRWEAKQTNQFTGEEERHLFDVPRLLDPNPNGKDCRSPEGCVVAHAGSQQRGDFVFEGDPTPDMEPLDAEAEAISARHRRRWQDPFGQAEPAGQNYSESLLMQMLTSQAERAVQPSANDKLVEQQLIMMKQMMEMNAQLMALLAPKPLEAEALEG